MATQPLRVFLAAPYSQWMDFTIGQVDPVWRERLDSLRRSMIEDGAIVFSAHHNEAWGAGWLPADKCTPIDFAAMLEADVVCAIVGSPASGGVLVELGWASALGKPIVLVLEADTSYTPLVHGLGKVTHALTVPAPADWSAEEISQITRQVMALGAQTTTLGAQGGGV